jgi:RNA polymerase-binding transcription factor DksA
VAGGQQTYPGELGELGELRHSLAAKRAELESELAALSAPAVDSGGISFGKRVGDGTSIAVERLTQVAAHDGLGLLLGEVVRAEAKIDDGTYGSCDRCGTPIAAERLAARAWATHCVTCPAQS